MLKIAYILQITYMIGLNAHNNKTSIQYPHYTKTEIIEKNKSIVISFPFRSIKPFV